MMLNENLLTKDYKKYLSSVDGSNIENKNQNIQKFLDAFERLRDERELKELDETDEL